MSEPLYYEVSVLLPAGRQEVWNALIQSEYTRQYMYGCQLICDWQVGSSLIWEGVHEGQPKIFVKGELLEFLPEQRMRFTINAPDGDWADVPENYIEVTYALEARGEQTLLTISQGDYRTVEKGLERYEDTINGWEYSIPLMKKLFD